MTDNRDHNQYLILGLILVLLVKNICRETSVLGPVFFLQPPDNISAWSFRLTTTTAGPVQILSSPSLIFLYLHTLCSRKT